MRLFGHKPYHFDKDGASFGFINGNMAEVKDSMEKKGKFDMVVKTPNQKTPTSYYFGFDYKFVESKLTELAAE